MSIALTESEFVDNLLSLSSIHPFKLDDDYIRPQSQLAQLGPPLPAFKYSYKKSKAISASESNVDSTENLNSNKTITLKSIKPKTVLKINSSDYDTVQDIKDYLLNEGLPGYFEFKLLNKGKVLLDYLSVSDVVSTVEGQELTLNLMCKPKPVEEIKTADETHEEDLFVESEQIVIPWDQFQLILEKKYGASEGLKALKKLQLGWEQNK
ncbi:hypothetical protein QEN19_004049 [Hanseniaspora menglaensis]